VVKWPMDDRGLDAGEFNEGFVETATCESRGGDIPEMVEVPHDLPGHLAGQVLH
jgi:hypothetical protein